MKLERKTASIVTRVGQKQGTNMTGFVFYEDDTVCNVEIDLERGPKWCVN